MQRFAVAAFGVLIAALFPRPSGAQQGTQFFTLTPCRVYDSRWGAGPLAGGFDRWIPVGGYCGIPPDASAGTFNFTAINPNGTGLLSAYPCCALRSNVLLSVKTGKPQAGFGVLGLGSGGQLGTYLDAPFSTTADLAVDVTGYFRPPAPVQQWQPWEQVLLSPADFTANDGVPYAEVEVDVRFTSPATGETFLQPAYWDGEDGDPLTYRVGMSFPAGSWIWQIDRCEHNGASCLAGWTPNQGTIEVQSNTTTGNPLYDRGFVQQVATVVGGQIVALSDLQFADGTTFTWVGDTAWSAPPREYDPPSSQAAQTTSWSTYLSDRKARGFTTIQIAPAVSWQPQTGDGWRPLPSPKGFSFNKLGRCTDAFAATIPIPNIRCWDLNKKYWNKFKAMVADAADAGFQVAIVGIMNPVGIPVDQKYPDEASAKKFARELLGRVGQFPVILSPGFDDDPDKIDPGSHQHRQALMDAVGLELQKFNANHRPLTNHLASGRANCDEYHQFSSWASHYLFQSGHGGAGDQTDSIGECAPGGVNDVDDAMKRARVMPYTLSRLDSPRRPAVNGEGPYDPTDYASIHPNVDTRYRLRQAAYLSALSDAGGFTYGVSGLSLWDQPGGNVPGEPARYFTLPSVADMTMLKANLLGHKLASHPDWILNNPATQKYKMVLASDGPSVVLAYLPGDEPIPQNRESSAEIWIDSGRLPCPVCPTEQGAPWSFTWIDPRNNGAAQADPQDARCDDETPGELRFTRPLCGAQANCDWLLKVEKTATGCPAASAARFGSIEAQPSTVASAVEVWTDTSAGDGTSAVYAAPWSGAGRQGPILLSPAGRAFQLAPRVDRLGSHQLVVWQADRLDGSLYGIYGALVGPRGEISGPFKVNHYTEHDQREPGVAGGPQGDALVVWSSYGQDGDRGGVFGRMVRVRSTSSDPLQAPMLGEEVQIAEIVQGHQRNPQVVADSGGYWVAWETEDANGLSSALSVRRLGQNGRPEGAEERLAAPPAEQRRLVSLESPTPDGVFVRWWEEDALGRNLDTQRQFVGPRGAPTVASRRGE